MSDTIDFGIDLGTTNSSIALCRDGSTRVFQSVDLMQVTPSVVYIGRSGRMLAGKKAYDTWVADPQNTQAEFKRWMGFSDRLKFPASGKEMSAEELSAEVLKALRADVMRQTNEDVTSTVITVPAAFGSLQCEATARAAKLAGIEEAPLLQEPIAAAIAYGAGPASRDQRWMAFDLGGGTLDIAVVSTRNESLAVLEHQGDNRLGGKDIDRLLADMLFDALHQTFAVPQKETDPNGHARLYRALVRQAEHAKIALSTATETTVDLFNLGDDRDGKPIELSLPVRRDELERRMQPLIDRCLSLVTRAIQGARLTHKQIDRILLIGGPTQMPVIQAALAAHVGAKLDHSLDPMTVVAQGAALYASTIKRSGFHRPASPTETPATAGAKSAVTVNLSHELASGSLRSPVAGVFPDGGDVHDVQINSEGGLWTSGWVTVKNNRFTLEVVLADRKQSTQFTLMARNKKGRPIYVQPSQFSVALMMPMAAPPLPHTIAVELTDLHGKTKYDPIFKRNSPLPAEARRSYTADRTLRPSEIESTLPIKFWEIEVSEDPGERWWAGCVSIRADRIKRPIPEGSELELTLKIDPSRKLSVEVFVPVLNESFIEGVYVPDPPTARSQLNQQLDLCFDRLAGIRTAIYDAGRDDLRERAADIGERLEEISERVHEEQSHGQTLDPDAMLAPTDALRKIRLQLSQMEEQLDTGRDHELIRKVRGDLRWTRQVVEENGAPGDAEELARLGEQFEKYAAANDPRGLKWVREGLLALRSPILDRTPQFWSNVLEYLRGNDRRFVNAAEARTWISKASDAQARQDLPAMREACNRAYALLPPDRAKTAKDQIAQSGLRGK